MNLILWAFAFSGPLLVWWNQRFFVYQSWGAPEQHLSPFSFDLPLPATFGKFQQFHLFKKQNANCTLYYYHGTGQTVESSYWHIGRLYHALPCSIMAAEYPGYSSLKSAETTECNIMRYATPLERFGQAEKRIYALGSSLGSAVVLQLANQFDAIILENPFTSINDLTHVPIPLLFDTWNSLLAAKRVKIHTLVLTSEHDRFVPIWMSEVIAKTCNATQFILSEASHGHAAAHPDYLPQVTQFIKKLEIH